MKKLLSIFAAMLLLGMIMAGCPSDTEEGTDDGTETSGDAGTDDAGTDDAGMDDAGTDGDGDDSEEESSD